MSTDLTGANSNTHGISTSDATSSRGAISGVGGGTILGLLINSIPDASPLKPFVITLAPSASVILYGLYVWLEGLIRQKRADNALRDWEQTLLGIIDDPNTSDEEREERRKELTDLRTIKLQLKRERFKILSVTQGGTPAFAQPGHNA